MDINLKIKHDPENPLSDNLWTDMEIMENGTVNIYNEEQDLLYSIGFEELLCLYKVADYLRQRQINEIRNDQRESHLNEIYKKNLLIEKEIKRLRWIE